MSENAASLPPCQQFNESIAILNLPISGSELHGILCGYLCAGAIPQAETYMRALMINHKKNAAIRSASMMMFNVFTISQQQLAEFVNPPESAEFNLNFELLIPDDNCSLIERAKAFSEWCEGFTQGLTLAGVGFNNLHEEDSQDALQHLQEFAELDYESLDVGEEDEQALMEVSEYTRMAVLRLHIDINSQKKKSKGEAH